MDRTGLQRISLFVAASGLVMFAGGCEFLSDPPTGPVSTSLIDEVYVIDAGATTCLSCPDGVIPAEVKSIIEAADPAMAGSWIQARFFSRDPRFDKYFKVGDPVKRGLSFDMGDEPAYFQGDGYQIHYENIPCRVWDCYKPRMWRVDDDGRQRWRSRVPYARAPVQPFVVGDYVLFIGDAVDGDTLILVDVNTGEVVGHFIPEGEKGGFYDSALLHDPAFYRDGYIYLRGHTVELWRPGTFETESVTPAKIYVLKVRF